MTDLSTVARVKEYLVIGTAGQDANIGQLIARESRFIERWLGRSFGKVTQTNKRLNGTGTEMMMLPDTPIISISSLMVDAKEIPASADGIVSGYIFDESTIYLIGQRFPYCRQNTLVSWTAGFQESVTANIPTGNTPTYTPAEGGFAITDGGVVNANTGAALTHTSNTPATGQYGFSAGTYSFASADANLPVTMTYVYVPGPVEQALIEMVGLDLKQRDNLGIASKSLAGEMITYSDKGMSASVKEMLQPYRKVAPV